MKTKCRPCLHPGSSSRDREAAQYRHKFPRRFGIWNWRFEISGTKPVYGVPTTPDGLCTSREYSPAIARKPFPSALERTGSDDPARLPALLLFSDNAGTIAD